VFIHLRLFFSMRARMSNFDNYDNMQQFYTRKCINRYFNSETGGYSQNIILILNPVVIQSVIHHRQNPLESNSMHCIEVFLVLRSFAHYTRYHHTRSKSDCSGNDMKATFNNILADGYSSVPNEMHFISPPAKEVSVLSKSKSCYNRRSVSQYAKVSSPLWDLWPDIAFCPKVVVWKFLPSPCYSLPRRLVNLAVAY
jgi:hypothetical protein